MTAQAEGRDEAAPGEAPALGSWPAVVRGLPGAWRRDLAFTPPVLSRLLLAFVLAIALWVYVTAQKNPVITKTFANISITPHGLPRGYVISPSLPLVTVKLNGLEQDLQTITASSIVATIDARTLSPTSPAKVLPVAITLPSGRDINLVDQAPDRIQVAVDTIASQSIAVNLLPIGQPPAGYAQDGVPQVEPQAVTISGLRSVLERIHSANVEVDLSNAVQTIQEARAPVLLDSSGRAVTAPSLSVNPAVVQVSIPIKSQVAFKSVSTVATVIGVPRAGYHLVGIRVSPQSLTVFGPPATINVMNTISTEPVSDDDLAGTRVITTAVRPPLSVGVSSGQLVTVTLIAEPITETVDLPVPVVLHGVPHGWKAAAEPLTATVRLTGSATRLASVSLAGAGAGADVSGQLPGKHALNLTVIVPQDAHLVAVMPETVTVTLTSGKVKGGP